MSWYKRLLRRIRYGALKKKENNKPESRGFKIFYTLLIFLFIGIAFILKNVNPLIFIFFVFSVIYLKYYRKRQKFSLRTFLSLSMLYLLYFPMADFVIQNGYSPFVLPVAGGAMLVMLHFNDFELMFIFSLLLSMTMADIFNGNLYHFLLLALISLLSGMLAQNVRLRSQLLTISFYQGLFAIFLYYLMYLAGTIGNVVMANVWGCAIGAGISLILVLLGTFPLFEKLFGTLTNMSLIELADTRQPLLKKLIMEAPGTYHHSLIVGNLAEAAGEAIGANALLARIGAYYHDIGKIPRAEYFVENQIGIDNQHEKLSPSLSKLILMNHVKEGVELAKKYRLPGPIVDFVAQHHGKSLAVYFYQKALEESPEGVKEEDFRYPGPKPQTREVAIVLLADAVEAAARTLQNPTVDRINQLVRKVVSSKFEDGQLDECNLTLIEVNKIINAFTKTLSSMHHQRVAYPESKNAPKGKNGKQEQANNGNVSGQE